MNWKSIRLELGRTHEFPNGSASRAYILRAPLTDDGAIDACALDSTPQQATFRRLWPSEPDVSGYLIRDGSRLAFVAGRAGTKGAVFSEIEAQAWKEGELLTLHERGRDLPFRVARLSSLS